MFLKKFTSFCLIVLIHLLKKVSYCLQDSAVIISCSNLLCIIARALCKRQQQLQQLSINVYSGNLYSKMDDVLAFLPIKTMNFMCKCERLLGALVLFNKLRFLLKCLINISLPATQITYVHTHYCLTHIKLCIYTKRFQFTFIHILFNVLLHCWAVFNYTVCSFFCLQ